MLQLNSQGRPHPRGRPGICAAIATACVALAACDSTSGGAPGAVSEGEARALEEAAQMLEERRLPDGVVPDSDAPVTVAPAEAGQSGDNAD